MNRAMPQAARAVASGPAPSGQSGFATAIPIAWIVAAHEAGRHDADPFYQTEEIK